MLNVACTEGLITSEQYSDKQNTVDDGSFGKIPQCDISCRKRLHVSIILADAVNYYDRVRHLIMALVFLFIGIQTNAIASMIWSTQLMKLFLRTGWGKSTNYFGGDILCILHNQCQENGAAPTA